MCFPGWPALLDIRIWQFTLSQALTSSYNLSGSLHFSLYKNRSCVCIYGMSGSHVDLRENDFLCRGADILSTASCIVALQPLGQLLQFQMSDAEYQCSRDQIEIERDWVQSTRGHVRRAHPRGNQDVMTVPRPIQCRVYAGEDESKPSHCARSWEQFRGLRHMIQPVPGKSERGYHLYPQRCPYQSSSTAKIRHITLFFWYPRTFNGSKSGSDSANPVESAFGKMASRSWARCAAIVSVYNLEKWCLSERQYYSRESAPQSFA